MANNGFELTTSCNGSDGCTNCIMYQDHWPSETLSWSYERLLLVYLRNLAIPIKLFTRKFCKNNITLKISLESEDVKVVVNFYPLISFQSYKRRNFQSGGPTTLKIEAVSASSSSSFHILFPMEINGPIVWWNLLLEHVSQVEYL